jgi:hypothetical protein
LTGPVTLTAIWKRPSNVLFHAPPPFCPVVIVAPVQPLSTVPNVAEPVAVPVHEVPFQVSVNGRNIVLPMLV